MAQESNQAAQQPTPRERYQARRKAGATPRAASPTRTIEPGVVHYQIAQGLLTGLQNRAATQGIPLDVGEFPTISDATTADSDPQQLANITAHAVARIADRFTLVRRISRHLEGSEKRAGILSDLAAAFTTLYKRNPDVFARLGQNFVANYQTQRNARTATQNGNPAHTEGVASHAS